MVKTRLPPRLYKYVPFSARTLTALKARTLWFGRPSQLNDPYDCAVPLRFRQITIEDCQRVLRSKEADHWAPVHADPRCVDTQGRPTEFLRVTLQRSGEKALRQLAEDTYTKRGVTCFSEDPENTLLWSHYGGAHRGLCLEFDTSSPWLSKLHKVYYSDDIPEYDITDLLVGDPADVLWPLLTKSACWAYEKEWRAIHQEADTVYCYGVEALTGVYLGARLSRVEKDLVAHILHGSPTQLYSVARSETSFRLQSELVNYAPFEYHEPNRSNKR